MLKIIFNKSINKQWKKIINLTKDMILYFKIYLFINIIKFYKNAIYRCSLQEEYEYIIKTG